MKLLLLFKLVAQSSRPKRSFVFLTTFRPLHIRTVRIVLAMILPRWPSCTSIVMTTLAFATMAWSAPTGDPNSAIILSGTQLLPTDFYSIISNSAIAPTTAEITAEDENPWLVEFYSPHVSHSRLDKAAPYALPLSLSSFALIPPWC